MNLSQLKQSLGNNLWRGENSHRQNRARHFSGVPFLQRQALVSLVMPDGTRVWGIDLSHWNPPPVNLKRMVELYNLAFVIIKGCDGSLNTRYYFEHVAAAKEAGIPWGMYVWLYKNTNVNIDAQVNAWHARYTIDPPPLGAYIDAEWTYYGGLPANPTAGDLRLAHDKWKNKSGRAATTYTAKGYADTWLVGFDWSREELWVASWGGNTPLYPLGAKTHAYWQFTSSLNGALLDPNGNAELDGSYFNGDRIEFNKRYGAVKAPNGGTMEYGKVKTLTNIRNSPPGGTYQDIGDLLVGDEVAASEIRVVNGYDWWRLASWKRNGVVQTLPAGECWAYGVNIEKVTPSVPDGVELVFTESGVTKRYKMTGTWEVS